MTFSSSCPSISTVLRNEHVDFAPFFNEVTGTIVVADERSDDEGIAVYNEMRAGKRFSPGMVFRGGLKPGIAIKTCVHQCGTRNELPFRIEHQRLVKDIIIIEAGREWILRAQTGWNGTVGWWVGWVEWPTGPVFFALNIDTPDRLDDLPKRESIGRSILNYIGALPKERRPKPHYSSDFYCERRLPNITGTLHLFSTSMCLGTLSPEKRHKAPIISDTHHSRNEV